jgi:hypothetical protein
MFVDWSVSWLTVRMAEPPWAARLNPFATWETTPWTTWVVWFWDGSP